MSDRLFLQSNQRIPPILLRRTGGGIDEAFLDGQWQPTKIIVDYMFGHDDFVEEITEAKARQLEPAAFSAD